MKLHPFIFNWRGQFDKVVATEKQLRELGYPPVVINSDNQYAQPGWVNVGEEAYFTRQFLTALDKFDGDVLFHVQGDATYERWHEVIERAFSTFEQYRWGVYAPDVDYTYHDSGKVKLESIECEDPDLAIVSCTDCTCWFIHKDIIDAFLQRNIDLSENKCGWGIDVLFCAVSFFIGRPVIRDHRHVVQHPKGTGYSMPVALSEMNSLFDSLDTDLKIAVRRVRTDKESLADYIMANR